MVDEDDDDDDDEDEDEDDDDDDDEDDDDDDDEDEDDDDDDDDDEDDDDDDDFDDHDHGWSQLISGPMHGFHTLQEIAKGDYTPAATSTCFFLSNIQTSIFCILFARNPSYIL